MKTLVDILQGMGVSAAAGLRPFLPTLVVGGFATADVGVDFEGTPFAFLESPWFLLAVTVALVVSVLLHARIEASPAGEAAIAGIGLGLGALLFAGTLDDRHAVWWPGLVGGILCGLIAQAGARSLITRTRVRLDAEAAAALFSTWRPPRSCSRVSRSWCPRSACSPWASSSGCAPVHAGARARSTRACAS